MINTQQIRFIQIPAMTVASIKCISTSPEKDSSMVKQLKKKEKQIARDAIKSHGDVEKYMDEMISNLGHLSEVVGELMRSGKEELDRKANYEGR